MTQGSKKLVTLRGSKCQDLWMTHNLGKFFTLAQISENGCQITPLSIFTLCELEIKPCGLGPRMRDVVANHLLCAGHVLGIWICGCSLFYSTPPIAEIIWVKNVRAIVVCGFLMK
jgi:hypothetical protein